MEPKIQVGDTVILRGFPAPLMTVNSLWDSGKQATCVWFVGTALYREHFNVDALEKA